MVRPNHINVTALEDKLILQMFMYDGEKKAWNWEKYVAQHVEYHNALGNLMEYGYQGLDPGSKVQNLLNGIRYEMLSTGVTAVRAHLDKYEKGFNAVVAFIAQHINKESTSAKCESCLCQSKQTCQVAEDQP